MPPRWAPPRGCSRPLPGRPLPGRSPPGLRPPKGAAVAAPFAAAPPVERPPPGELSVPGALRAGPDFGWLRPGWACCTPRRAPDARSGPPLLLDSPLDVAALPGEARALDGEASGSGGRFFSPEPGALATPVRVGASPAVRPPRLMPGPSALPDPGERARRVDADPSVRSDEPVLRAPCEALARIGRAGVVRAAASGAPGSASRDETAGPRPGRDDTGISPSPMPARSDARLPQPARPLLGALFPRGTSPPPVRVISTSSPTRPR